LELSAVPIRNLPDSAPFKVADASGDWWLPQAAATIIADITKNFFIIKIINKIK
jgi:hypothetical protein